MDNVLHLADLMRDDPRYAVYDVVQASHLHRTILAQSTVRQGFHNDPAAKSEMQEHTEALRAQAEATREQAAATRAQNELVTELIEAVRENTNAYKDRQKYRKVGTPIKNVREYLDSFIEEPESASSWADVLVGIDHKAFQDDSD